MSDKIAKSVQIVTLAIAAVVASSSTASAACPQLGGSTAPPNGSCLELYVRPDHKVETYFAGEGDGLLAASVALANDFWNREIQGNLAGTLGQDDGYVPPALLAAGHNGALALEVKIATVVGAASHSSVIEGLVGRAPARQSVQSIDMPLRFGELVGALPSLTSLRDDAKTHARATQTAFGGAIAGVYWSVDVRTGLPTDTFSDPPRCLINLFAFRRSNLASIGFGMRGMTEIMIASGDSSLRPWLDDKLTFLETFAGSPRFMRDKYTEIGACPDENPSTDNLYFARSMLAAAGVFNSALDPLATRMRQRGLAVIDGWATSGFDDSVGHVRTHSRLDGSPVLGSEHRMYGDSKWNFLFALAAAINADPSLSVAYLGKARTQYETMRATARSAFIDCEYDLAGAPGGNGLLENDLPILAAALLELHKASLGRARPANMASDYFRLAARDAARTALHLRGLGYGGCDDDDYDVLANVNDRDSRSMTAVTFGVQTVRRLELLLRAKGSTFTILQCETPFTCSKDAFPTPQPPPPSPQLQHLPAFSEVAVVYLPQGTYRVTSGGVTKTIALTSDQVVAF